MMERSTSAVFHAVFVKIVVHFFKPLAARIRCSVAAAGLG
jgi:hypothetical protein